MHPETGAFLKLNSKILRIYSLLNSVLKVDLLGDIILGKCSRKVH